MHAHCASGCCGSHAAWPCPCPVGGSERLTDAATLVACYLQTQGGLAAEQAYFQTLDSPGTALREALLALGEDEGLRPDHTPLQQIAIDRLTSALTPLAASLATCSDFADLHTQLFEVGSKHGLEPAAAYDTALRFGMQTGLLPSAVFCHAANRDTLQALGITPPDSGWVDPCTLPDAIASLPPHEIERCLSLCHNQWQRLTMK